MKKSKLIEVMTDAPASVWLRLTKKVSWAYRMGRDAPPVFELYTGSAVLPERAVWDEIRKEVNRARRIKRYQVRKTAAERNAIERRDYMRTYMRKYRKKENDDGQ